MRKGLVRLLRLMPSQVLRKQLADAEERLERAIRDSAEKEAKVRQGEVFVQLELMTSSSDCIHHSSPLDQGHGGGDAPQPGLQLHAPVLQHDAAGGPQQREGKEGGGEVEWVEDGLWGQRKGSGASLPLPHLRQIVSPTLLSSPIAARPWPRRRRSWLNATRCRCSWRSWRGGSREQRRGSPLTR